MTLSEMMQKYETLKRECDELEAMIKSEVIALGSSQKVGNVSATLSKGRGSYDWEKIARGLEPDEETVAKYTSTTVKTDWKLMVEEFSTVRPAEEIETLKQKFYTEGGAPTVSVKLK